MDGANWNPSEVETKAQAILRRFEKRNDRKGIKLAQALLDALEGPWGMLEQSTTFQGLPVWDDQDCYWRR